MPCSSTSQLTNAPSVPLSLTLPTTNAQWAIFVQRLTQLMGAIRDAGAKTGVNVIPAAYAVYDASALPPLIITGATAALDSSTTQFGNASLKLTATATTVTVEFPSGTITMAPFARWIESVYIRSSRTSITGTLAVVTPAASYPVDIGGTLTPASWGRLYGDCDLTADDSSSATILLTLTGVTVGDTFNLEAWQLEAASGQTNLPSAFVNSAAPGSLSAVPDDTTYAKILASHTAGNVSYNFRGVWSSTTGYLIGDETVYAGAYWLCTQAGTGHAPVQSSAYWQAVGAYNDYQGAWSAAIAYQPGMEVTYGGNFWVAAAANTNSVPVAGNANWAMAGPASLDNVVDGPSGNRSAVANADIYVNGGINRVGLRVAGSGQTVGDQRNLMPVTWAGVRSVNSTSPITYTYTWNASAGLYNISVNVAAYTLYAGTFSLNYAASSLSGTQAASTTVSAYYYYLDPTSSGGSLALHYATDPAVLAQQNGIVFIGFASLTTPAPDSAPGGGAGSGGGGFCVADDMFIGEGRLAGNADIGDPFDCIDLPTAAGKHVRALQGFTRGVEECVRMITSDGCALVCSLSTPFDLPDGRNTTAPHMLGEQVITDLGAAAVVSLALVGPKPVTRAHLGGVSYAAGADPQRRIYSHNAGVSKP